MYSVDIQTKAAQGFEPLKGLKSLDIATSNKQTIELQTGLKSLSIGIAVPGGGATKIFHYKNYVPQILTYNNYKLRFNTNDGYPADAGCVRIIDYSTGQIVGILDYGSGITNTYKNNPPSYDISYFNLINDTKSFGLQFTDYGTFAGAGNYVIAIATDHGNTIQTPPITPGGTTVWINAGKSYIDNNNNPLTITIRKA